jgi:hypothetical protein
MKKVLIAVSASLAPLSVFAQSPVYQTGTGVGGLIYWANWLLNALVPLLIGIAVVYFIWEVFQYTIAADEDKKKTARTQIIWGIVGIFVMVSVWGLVNILQSTFGTQNTNSSSVSMQINGLVPPAR